jgi:hypothetical protein
MHPAIFDNSVFQTGDNWEALQMGVVCSACWFLRGESLGNRLPNQRCPKKPLESDRRFGDDRENTIPRPAGRAVAGKGVGKLVPFWLAVAYRHSLERINSSSKQNEFWLRTVLATSQVAWCIFRISKTVRSNDGGLR